MKVLIIRRDNIGDLICTTPLFEAIRRQYPDAYIAALVNSYNAPAIQGNPHLDAIFSYTKGKHAEGETVIGAYWRRARLLWQLRRMRFDYVVLATSGFAARALKLAKLIAPQHIVGFVTESSASSRIDMPVAHAPGVGLHETEDMFRLLGPLGVSGDIPRLTVVPDPQKVAEAHQKLNMGLRDEESGPLVALHISARKEKQRWPVENFAALAHQLHARFNARLLLFWSPGAENNPFHPGDDGKAAQLLAAMSELPVFPMQTAHLSELIAGLSLCDIAVLSDGGAMHVAAGLGKPMVCFFGNSPAARWHPWRVPYELIQKPTKNVADISVGECVDAFLRVIPKSELSGCQKER